MAGHDVIVVGPSAGGMEAPLATDAYLSTIVRVSNDAIIGVAGDGTIQSWNSAAERTFGYTPTEAAGRPIALLAPPGYEAEQQAIMARLRVGEVVSVETVRLAKDGRAVHVQLNATPILNAAGQLVLIAATLNDISERKGGEEALRESEERYRTLFESIDEGFCIIEMLFDEQNTPLDYRFLEVNPAFERHTGLKAATGKQVRELAPLLEEHWFGIYGNIALTGEPVRFEQGAAQLQRWFDVYAFRVGDPHARRVAILFNDITARKQAEAALRESEERYRALTELSPDAVCVNLDGCFVYSNPAAARLLRASEPQALIGLSAFDVTEPEYHELIHERMGRVLGNNGTAPLINMRWRRLDGSVVDVEVAAGAVPWQGRRAIQVIFRDITERKLAEAERERLLQETEEARREAEAAVKARDQFLSIASHELRTPLTTILGYADVIQAHVEGQSGANATTRRQAGTILRQAQRLNRLIDHLLDVTQLQRGQFTLERQPVDLGMLVAQDVEEFRLTLPPVGRHTITLLRPDEPVQVLGDPDRLTEIVHNLLGNAVKYSPEGGTVAVRVAVAADEAVLDVADQGIGIPAEAQARLFEPFYRAENVSPQSSGFGIGLYVVHELVQRHGGRVEVESTEGAGSRFRAVLPLYIDESTATIRSKSVSHGRAASTGSP